MQIDPQFALLLLLPVIAAGIGIALFFVGYQIADFVNGVFNGD